MSRDSAPYAPGTRVRIIDLGKPGHVRTPFYVREKVGTIERLCGTFENPEERASRNGLKKLQKLQDLFEKEDYAGTIALAQEVGNDPDANAYEKGFAWLLAGNAASSTGDDAQSATFFQNALATNGLDNNNHYTVMYNLAAVEYGLEQYQQALDTIDRFLTETKTDKPEGQGLKGGLLVALERYDDAARLYEETRLRYMEVGLA